jgi:hypothetical protein
MRSIGANALTAQQAEKTLMQQANVDFIGPIDDQETIKGSFERGIHPQPVVAAAEREY